MKSLAQALAAAPGLDVPVVSCEPGEQAFQLPPEQTLERFPDGSGNGGGDSEQTLEDYTQECELAVGFTFPDVLSCEDGNEVPGQAISCDAEGVYGCDTPNVLNQACDPGSKFQRLPLKQGDSPNAAAVMHCRKKGYEEPGVYGDIAIIMSNSVNGATCFFQALGKLNGVEIASPKRGVGAWEWMSPLATANTGCTGCHDNGSFIRTPYLAQMPDMPNAAEGFGNSGGPLRWVGKAFADKQSWSVQADKAACLGGTSGENCLTCTSCHVLAVNNYWAAPVYPTQQGITHEYGRGTALDFGVRATAAFQRAKHAHSAASPIWMYPGQEVFDDNSHQAALEYAKCAAEFLEQQYGNGTPMSASCHVQELGGPWLSPSQPQQ